MFNHITILTKNFPIFSWYEKMVAQYCTLTLFTGDPMKQITAHKEKTIRRMAHGMMLAGLLTVFSPALLQAATQPDHVKIVPASTIASVGEEVLSVVTITSTPGDALGKISALVEKSTGKKFKAIVNVYSGEEEVISLSATVSATATTQGDLLKKMSSIVDIGKGKAYKVSVKIVRME
jgi:hypothetical protein